MADYDNTNTFVLFKNDKGDNPKRPDYTGNANVDGVEFRISGWIREGANGKFISGSVQMKEAAKSVENNEDVPF
jgi:hypothetical protein